VNTSCDCCCIIYFVAVLVSSAFAGTAAFVVSAAVFENAETF